MAETEAEALPNGTGGFSAEEDDERLKQRPADIDADVREMERRKRVEAIMSSRLFREELERVLDQQLSEGGGAAPLLERIREMVGTAGAARLHAGTFKGGNCVLPINDIRGIEGMGYEKGEKILRCKLAAVYRLVDLYGWTQAGIGGQITARLNTAAEHFLTAPRGLLPHEVTASALVKLDMQGVVQDHGTTNFPVNPPGFALQACVHAARPDVRCVLHVRSPAALAVSAQRDGLLPLCSEAALLGDIAYHHLPPGTLDNEERDKLIRALGPTAKVLVLSNGGALCCGETLEEAFYQAKCLAAACDVQLRLSAVPVDKLTLLDDETRKQLYDASRRAPADGVKWRVGGEEFEALMRMLDNAGYRTGYIYRHPLVKGDVPKPKNDVEVPPAVSSLGYLLEEEELYRQGLWKKLDPRKAGDRTRWLNSPNVYQKVEVLETGTTDPKKITKWVDANNEEWVQDGSPAHSSTPVRIDAALQFVPKNTNPKEFKKLQQQIKDNRRADKISAGPQSHILEGVTWDEANKLNAEDAAATHTGDHVVLMGAASKGIIQRGYQHNATVYSAPYARNPFDQVSDRDLDDYKRTVERKARGEYDADVSESEGLSAAQLTSPDCQPSETEEESRDDHRILRIETKQAPRPSQPEVVLSDDCTDFISAERRAAESTPRGDSLVVSDDEVFLAPPPSVAGAGPAAGRAGGGVLADGGVLVRSYRAPVQQTIVRGVKGKALPKHASRSHASATNPANFTHDPSEVYSTNRRSLHEYPRSPRFQNVVKMFEDSLDTELEQCASLKHSHQPRCKTSLSSRLVSSEHADVHEHYVQSQSSGRSSLCSIPSIEFDSVRNKNDSFRTRSLPRSRAATRSANLFRTHSHAGFVNAFIGDPEPAHFHLPRCRSCGTFNQSYAWELYEKRSSRSSSFENTLCANQSSCNVPNRLKEQDGESLIGVPIAQVPKSTQTSDAQIVNVKQIMVPLFHAVKVNLADRGNEQQEWVECQEFTDDNLEDVGGSFSSENQTVIEKISPKTSENCMEFSKDILPNPPQKEVGDAFDKVLEELKQRFVGENESVESLASSLEAEVDSLSDRADEESSDTSEGFSMFGEYLNYSDELEFEDTIYESPVKDLVEKDIRNYSVPITLYCDDFSKYVPNKSPKRSPVKIKVSVKGTLLEPIQEESKSSYNEDSVSNSSVEDNKIGNHKINSEAKIALATIDEKPVPPSNEHDLSYEIHESIEQPITIADIIIDVVSIVDDIVLRVFAMVQIKLTLTENKIQPSTIETKYMDANTNNAFVNKSIETRETPAVDNESEQFRNKECKDKYPADFIFKVPKISDATRSSNASSSIRDSFESTAEFERTEAVSEILGVILERVNFSKKYTEDLNKDNAEFMGILSRRKFSTLENLSTVYDEKKDNVDEFNRFADATHNAEFVCKDMEHDIPVSIEFGNGDGTEPSMKYVKDKIDLIEVPEDQRTYMVIENKVDAAVGQMKAEEVEILEQDSLITKPVVILEMTDAEIAIPMEVVRPLSPVDVDKIDDMNDDLDLTYTIPDDVTSACGELSNKSSIKLSNDLDSDGSAYREIELSNVALDLDTSNNSNDAECNPMDLAFVEGSYKESLTSSPLNVSRVSLIQCLDESPIKNENTSFSSDNLYEKEDNILGSPFIKRAPIITMSHTAQRGGVKFWISFDEGISPRAERPLHRRYRSCENVDDKTPSFLVAKFQDESPTGELDSYKNDESTDSSETTMADNTTLTDDCKLDINEPPQFFDEVRSNRRSVLCESALDRDIKESCEDFDRSAFLNSLKFADTSGSYVTADTLSNQASDSFATCDTAQSNDRNEAALSPQKVECVKDTHFMETTDNQFKKLYDSSKAGRIGRGFSWPPFEDTLFYRIMSKFRMSESFDLNEFEKLSS